MAKLELTYETKCRRCGKITEWFGGYDADKSDRENWLRLHDWVTEHFDHPSVCRCDKCKKDTIQDYVSYTG